MASEIWRGPKLAKTAEPGRYAIVGNLDANGNGPMYAVHCREDDSATEVFVSVAIGGQLAPEAPERPSPVPGGFNFIPVCELSEYSIPLLTQPNGSGQLSLAIVHSRPSNGRPQA